MWLGRAKPRPSQSIRFAAARRGSKRFPELRTLPLLGSAARTGCCRAIIFGRRLLQFRTAKEYRLGHTGAPPLAFAGTQYGGFLALLFPPHRPAGVRGACGIVRSVFWDRSDSNLRGLVWSRTGDHPCPLPTSRSATHRVQQLATA